MAYTGGAPAVVSQVMSKLTSVADTAATQTTSYINTAQAAAEHIPQLALPPVPRPPEAPEAPDLDADQYNPQNAFELEARKIVDGAAADFALFIETHLPGVGALVEQVESWIDTTMRSGGTGINAQVEDQIWARARERALREASRLKDQAATEWAARGYAMPPGALLHQTVVIDREAQEKINEASRERAIKAFDTELENVRFAITQTLAMRSLALSSALSYLGSVISSYQTAGQVSSNTADFYTKLNDTLVRFYTAQSEATMNAARIESANAGIAQQSYSSQLQANTAFIGHRVSVALAAAQMLGTRTAAALNGLHAQAGIQGQDITNITV